MKSKNKSKILILFLKKKTVKNPDGEDISNNQLDDFNEPEPISQQEIDDFNTKYENDSDHRNDQQFTKLHFAAKIDDVKMGEYLISTGANINAKDRYGILIKIIKHLFIMLQIMIQLK